MQFLGSDLGWGLYEKQNYQLSFSFPRQFCFILRGYFYRKIVYKILSAQRSMDVHT